MQQLPVEATHTAEPAHDEPVQTQPVPVALHRGVSPPQAVLQQTPLPDTSAMHFPLAHWFGVAVEQAAPFGFEAVQVPPLVARSHHLPGPHCVSLPQAPQEVPLAQ